MKRKIIGIFICMLLIVTALPILDALNIEKNNIDKSNIFPKIHDNLTFYDNSHHISIRLRNIYILESGDDGLNEPGEYYFYILAIPARFHFKTDIFSANDNIPTTAQNFGKLCTMSNIKFTPQRIIILALDDDTKDGPTNFNDLLDWIQIRFRPPKGDYSQSNMYEETFKWVNIYFRADVIIQFYYIDE
jgi:hypothetical protein